VGQSEWKVRGKPQYNYKKEREGVMVVMEEGLDHIGNIRIRVVGCRDRRG